MDPRTGAGSFERVAGTTAIAVAVGGFVYALLFVWIVAGSPDWVLSLWYWLLMGGAILSIVPLVAVYERVRRTDQGFALAGLLLGLAGVIGGAVHGAHLLYLQLNPAPGLPPGQPSPGDPAGIFRYGAAGLGLLVYAWLIRSGGRFPRWLGSIGLFGGGLLVLIYLGRLYDFITPNVKVSLIPPVLFGLVAFPAWWLGVGWSLRRGESAL
jgi:hypothetical protein